MSTLQYPKIRRDESVDDLFGTKVADPYRWLEDPKSPETQEFIAAQNALCDDYLSKFPHTNAYLESLTNTCNYERYGAPFRCGNRLYYLYNEGLKPQSVLYAIEGDAIDSAEKGTVFFDQNTLSEDGKISLNTATWTKDGSIFAYGLSLSGSDWCHAKFRTVSTGEDYLETLHWLKFTGLSFTHDNKGLFYQRYPEPVGVQDAGTETESIRDAMVYYHVLGTEQSEDILIYSDPESPCFRFGAGVTTDGEWLKMTTSNSTAPVNKFWLAKLDGKSLPADGKLEWIKIQDDFHAQLKYVDNNGEVFYFHTNDNAPNGKVVRYNVEAQFADFVTIVPEQPYAVLQDASLANEKYLVLTYLHNVQHKVLIVPLESLGKKVWDDGAKKVNGFSRANGSLKPHANGIADDATVVEMTEWIGLPDAEELDLPVGCSANYASCRRDEPRIFVKVSGYTLAGRIYKYTFKHVELPWPTTESQVETQKTTVKGPRKPFGELSIWRESIVPGFQPDRLIVEQVWVPNPNDGVKIPMYIVRDKAHVKTGDSFCLLYGYGGFSISLTPSFNPHVAAMLNHSGGIYCVANIRGGGEFGEGWHKAAIREKRPVAFADFEESGRYLIREGWTVKEKLVCQGESNGGALIGAVMNRAGEEIFAAGVAQAGVLDLLRYHLFTIGYAWKSEYGDPDVEEDFDFLYQWSPYHTVRDGQNYQYPAMFCETSDHDDRVVPLHSFKFVAALQQAAGKTNREPLLLRHRLKAGHGAGKPTMAIIHQQTEIFAFMMTATATKYIK